jgi:hypothetical protein
MNDPTNLLNYTESNGEITITIPTSSPNPYNSVIVMDTLGGSNPPASISKNTLAGKNDITISLFPNPVEDGILHIKQTGISTLDVTIYNINGQQVLNQKMSGKILVQDVSALWPGVYLVKVSDGEKVVTQKFIRK